MRRATGAMLAVALFAVALAVAGLAVGVVRVPRGAELGSFSVALLTALAAAWRTLGRLLEQGEEPPTRIPRETASEWLRRFDERHGRLAKERRAARWTRVLLAGSLVAGAGTAVLRSGAGTERMGSDRFPPVVVEHASSSGAPVWIAVAASGVLGLAAALLLGVSRRRAVMAGAAVAGTTGTLALSLGHLHITPRFDITPAVRVEQPTLFSLQPGSATSARPPVTLYAPVERRSLTLLSLGGLRIPLHLHGRSPCRRRRILPITR